MKRNYKYGKDTYIHWRQMCDAAVELSHYWRELKDLPEERFVDELSNLSGLDLVAKDEKVSGTSFLLQGDVVLTPFTRDVHVGCTKQICNKADFTQLKESNSILTLYDDISPLHTLLRAVRQVCEGRTILLYRSVSKNNHCLWHRFVTMIFAIANTIINHFDKSLLGPWVKNGVDVQAYKPTALAQENARLSIMPPVDKYHELTDILVSGCRGVCDYAEREQIILNVLMKCLTEFSTDRRKCTVKSNITDVSISQSSGLPLVKNVIPIDHNGVGVTTNGSINPQLPKAIEDALYGSIEEMLHNGSANIPSMESNTSMTNIRLLSKNSFTGKLLLRTGVTKLKLS
ncbi:MAG: hypothetical protein ACRBB4_09890 [Neptuniibacter sp.]